MATLKECLKNHLDRDWRHDLEPAWRDFFKGLDPLKLDELPEQEAPEVYPARLSLGDQPREAGDPVPKRHMTRAFLETLPLFEEDVYRPALQSDAA